MVRPPLSKKERARGERLGMLLREARGSRSMTEVAAVSGVPVETLRKIEVGRIATPAFFTVVALAASAGLSPEDVVAHCAGADAETVQAIIARCVAAAPTPPPPRCSGSRRGARRARGAWRARVARVP